MATDINKCKATVPALKYTGKPVQPGYSEIQVKFGDALLTDSDFEILSYKNNIKKGTATVIIKGKGNFGGTKSIKFKIVAKGMTF